MKRGERFGAGGVGSLESALFVMVLAFLGVFLSLWPYYSTDDFSFLGAS